MNKDEALDLFYAKNKISFPAVSNPLDGNYDERIAQLPGQIDRWLAQIAPADHSIFLELLSQYTYLTEIQCQLRYGEILSLLSPCLDQAGLSLSHVLFVTVESTHACKTGGDNVRADFQKRNLRQIQKRQIIATHSNLSPEEVRQYPVVVFLDDIIGSGITLWNEIQTFCQRFQLPYNGHPQIFFACIAPRRHGVRHLVENCDKYGIPIYGLYRPEWFVEPAFPKGSDTYLQLEPYERLIGTYMTEPSKSYFMGFQKNRLLVSFHYNTPNNTLSTFWREIPGRNAPPFYRDGNQPPQRPSIDDLKAKKNVLRQDAYQQGVAYWEKQKTL